MFIADFRNIFRSAVYARSQFSDAQLLETTNPRVIGVALTENLYKSHLLFFTYTKALVEKMEKVLDDPEHRLCMNEGRDLGFNLPSEEAFHKFIKIYNAHFHGFDPFRTEKSGNKITLTGDQAKAFIDNRYFAAELYDALDTAIFQTQYMDLIRHLKNNGAGYAGPSIFQEIMNWQITAASLMRKEHESIQDETQITSIVQYLSAPKSKRQNVAQPCLDERMQQFCSPL